MNVIGFIESTGTYLSGTDIALPSDKKVFKKTYRSYKGSNLSGAEESAVNHIYEMVASDDRVPASKPQTKPIQPYNPKPAKEAVMGFEEAEKALIGGKFYPVYMLSEGLIPNEPGLYCIKLRKDCQLPSKFGTVREDGIIYIGLASSSLRKRFWKQELNLIGHATLFRSIGSILGYYPEKGSLVGKSNKYNFRFADEDIESIRDWIRQSLEVNCVVYSANNLSKIEEDLIKKYRPLVNIDHNPTPSEALITARKERVEYANRK